MFRISARFKRIVALVVVMMLVVLLVSSAVVHFTGSADEQQDLENKQQELNENKQQIEGEIDELEGEKRSVMEEKKLLDEEVASLEAEIAEVNSQIAELEKKIEETTTELEKATEATESQYKLYGERVRVMYENRGTGYLNVLLSSKSVGDFFEKLDIVSQIANYDKTLTEELKTEQQKIMTMKANLETDKLALDESKSSLLASKAVLDSKMAERDAMIQAIEGSQSALEAQIKEIEAEEAAVRAQIARLANGDTAYEGGAMLWPTPSCKIITSYYGWRLHPVLGYEKLHTGMDIGASYGANIIAATSGTVITATYNSAYGNYVVIDHGGGVCTLYAHQSSMAVSVGQYVSAGQVIGYVGSTGYSTGPHLHFEVIINGSTVDPLGYIS